MTRSRRLLFSVLVTGLFLGAVEGVARVVEAQWFPYRRSLPLPAPMPQAESNTFRHSAISTRKALEQGAIPLASDPERGWTLTPQAVVPGGDFSFRTNADGLRGPEITPKPEGARRLMSLGDSSIFGDGVAEEKVFTEVAARELAAAWGTPVDAVNGGVPGHAAEQSLVTLQMVGPRARPDWVVIGNQWSDLYGGMHGIDDPTFLPASEGLRRIAVYRLLWRGLAPWLEARKVTWLAGREQVGSLDGEGTPTRTPLPRYIEALRTLARESEKLGARPVFLILPAPMDFDRVPPPETVLAFRAAIRTVGGELGAPVVDGPEAFRTGGANIGYFDDQVHPNTIGHAMLGHLVAEAILKFPEDPPR